MNKVHAFAVVVGLSFASQSALAAITVEVHASPAPNFLGSSSWTGYLNNALYALENGLSTYGTPVTEPSGYTRAGSTIEAGDAAVTSFNSWRGVVNPSGAFAGELGTRLHFGLHAYGDGTTQFRFQDLTWSITSSDSGNTLGGSGSFAGANFSASRFGIDWGADRQKGGGDDVIYSSGNGNTLVDEIVYVGVGNGWWPGGSDPTPSNPAGGAQNAMDQYYAWVAANAPITVTGTYAIGTYSGSDTLSVIPEPASLGLLCVAGLIGGRRRR